MKDYKYVLELEAVAVVAVLSVVMGTTLAFVFYLFGYI